MITKTHRVTSKSPGEYVSIVSEKSTFNTAPSCDDLIDKQGIYALLSFLLVLEVGQVGIFKDFHSIPVSGIEDLPGLADLEYPIPF